MNEESAKSSNPEIPDNSNDEKQDHTPEPWNFKAELDFSNGSAGDIYGPDGETIRSVPDALRTVSCVNALEGIKNPGGIPGVLEAVRVVIQLTDKINEDRPEWAIDEPEAVTKLRIALIALGIEEEIPNSYFEG